MSRYVVDSWAWVEYLSGSDKGNKVKHYMENEANTIITLSTTMTEMVSFFIRKQRDPHDATSSITSLSIVEPIDEDLAQFAGELHGSLHKSNSDIGLADAFVLAFARKNNIKIISGDPHFKKQKETIFIE